MLVIIALTWIKDHYDKEKQAKLIVNELNDANHLHLYVNVSQPGTKLETTSFMSISSTVALVFLAVFAILTVLSAP